MQYNQSFKYLPKHARALKTLAALKMGIRQWLAEIDIITYIYCNYQDELQKEFQGVHDVLIFRKIWKLHILEYYQ